VSRFWFSSQRLVLSSCVLRYAYMQLGAYLLIKYELWALGLGATCIVAAVCYALAQPVPGVGIAMPVFVPASTTAIVAVLLARQHAASLAYIGGSLGTLIGADLLDLGKIQGLRMHRSPLSAALERSTGFF
jgi:uncharacterized membrane protein